MKMRSKYKLKFRFKVTTIVVGGRAKVFRFSGEPELVVFLRLQGFTTIKKEFPGFEFSKLQKQAAYVKKFYKGNNDFSSGSSFAVVRDASGEVSFLDGIKFK